MKIGAQAHHKICCMVRFGIPHNVGAPALRLALWCAAPQPWLKRNNKLEI